MASIKCLASMFSYPSRSVIVRDILSIILGIIFGYHFGYHFVHVHLFVHYLVHRPVQHVATFSGLCLLYFLKPRIFLIVPMLISLGFLRVFLLFLDVFLSMSFCVHRLVHVHLFVHYLVHAHVQHAVTTTPSISDPLSYI